MPLSGPSRYVHRLGHSAKISLPEVVESVILFWLFKWKSTGSELRMLVNLLSSWVGHLPSMYRREFFSRVFG